MEAQNVASTVTSTKIEITIGNMIVTFAKGAELVEAYSELKTSTECPRRIMAEEVFHVVTL